MTSQIEYNIDEVPFETTFRLLSSDEYYVEKSKSVTLPIEKNDEDYYIMNKVTDTLLFLCARKIGMPKITLSTYRTIYNRINLYEKVHSPILSFLNPLTNEREHKYITQDDVYNHIGLTTNGIQIEKKDFLNNLIKPLLNAKHL